MRPGKARLPWSDHDFSARMLAEHLDDRHDLASRRPSTIDTHVLWLKSLLPEPRPAAGCGPRLRPRPVLERLVAAGRSASASTWLPLRSTMHDHAAALDLPCEYIVGDFRSTDLDGSSIWCCVCSGAQHRPDQRRAARIPSARGRRAVTGPASEQGTAPMSWYAVDGGLFAGRSTPCAH